MASLGFLAAAITTTFVASSILALPSNKLNSETPAISSAPAALLPNPPLSSYTELPPDIAPLLPSTGGTADPPTGSFMPTIPSTRSPPNPDITGSTGLDTAFAPSGSFQDSSAESQILMKGFGLDVFPRFLAFWLVVVFIV
ncbi:hypothetical protein Pfo_015972 [Paulownia fortunei]|nr:hypothetical protein Pfo_015972 [Paulownia fortunei]